MSLTNTEDRYGAVARALHWGMFVLIALLIAAVEVRDIFPKDSGGRTFLMELHKSCGVLVFALVWLRLAWRLLNSVPEQPEGPRWQQQLAGGMVVALYLLMIGLPLSGYLASSLAGRPVGLFGLFELPNPFTADEGLGHDIKELHELGGNLIIALVGLHMAAALYHHLMLKDTVLTRMLPPRKSA